MRPGDGVTLPSSAAPQPVTNPSLAQIVEHTFPTSIIDAMARGDVLVVDAGDTTSCGFWGELLTTACIYKGIRGVVMTACTRDMWKIRDLNFPVFGIGWHPGDTDGRWRQYPDLLGSAGGEGVLLCQADEA